jgi:hypothetical protein
MTLIVLSHAAEDRSTRHRPGLSPHIHDFEADAVSL